MSNSVGFRITVELREEHLDEGKLKKLRADIESLLNKDGLFLVKQKVGLNEEQIRVMLKLKTTSKVYNKYDSPFHAFANEEELISKTFDKKDDFFKAWYIGYFEIEDAFEELTLF